MIRRARPKDAPALRALALECIGAGIPKQREATPEQVRSYCEQAYQDLDRTLAQGDILVLLEEQDQEITGYLMLDFAHIEAATGEKQCFIVDLGVRADRRGHYATHRLIKKASQLAAARGLKYLVGMVSCDNERTLRLAQKALDFQVERVQIVRRCC